MLDGLREAFISSQNIFSNTQWIQILIILIQFLRILRSRKRLSKQLQTFFLCNRAREIFLLADLWITATTIANINTTFFLVNNTNDQPPFYSNLSQNWEGGTSNIKSTYKTNKPPPFSSNLSQNWGGGAKTILTTQVNDPLTLCALRRRNVPDHSHR